MPRVGATHARRAPWLQLPGRSEAESGNGVPRVTGNDGAVTGLKGASSCLLVTLFLWFGSEAQRPKPGFAPKGWTGGGAGGNRVDRRWGRRAGT